MSEQLQTPGLQQAINVAVQHHTAGRVPEAESIYRNILHTDPNQPVVLHLLGVIAHQSGKNDKAVDLITKALSLKPDFAEAHSNLGLALQVLGRPEDAVAGYHKALALKPDYADAHYNLGNALKELGQPQEAVASYQKALALKPDFADACNNLGNALKDLGKREDALASYRKALNIKPDYAEAHYNLGNLLTDIDRPDDGVAHYRKAIDINPDFAEAHKNLGTALQYLGKLDEAVQVLQTALVKVPGNILITDCLIELLNHHMPSAGARGPHAKAQDALQRVIPKYTGTAEIADETVQQVYQQCHSILASHELGSKTNLSQIYRGALVNLGCDRHLKVFDTFKIIPEYCFSCYKVLIEPRTVVELIKLMLVFDRLELPSDNIRKCMVELRPEISGTYKGYIFCKNFAEGKAILNAVQPLVGERISKKIPVSLKRGCSEYSMAYPEYGHVENNSPPLMTYNEEWREHEDYADKNLTGHIYPCVYGTRNHLGMTLCDALIMREWLAYAAAIGDVNYLKVSGSPVQKMSIERTSFHPVEDE